MFQDKPDRHFSVAEVLSFSEPEWIELVRKLAFPERARTMVRTVTLAKERDLKHIVETGCIRGCAGDGQSTLIFAMLSLRIGGSFSTFDNSEIHMGKAKSWLGPLAETMAWNLMDSVEGLSRRVTPADLVYLDSYDYAGANPRPCQLHQLAEVGAIYGKLTPKSVIVMDDAKLDGGGKIAMSSDFLKGRGWKIAEDSTQLVMLR